MRLFPFLSVSLLIGCGTTEPARTLGPGDDPSNICLRQLESEARFHPLLPRIGSPTHGRTVTLEMTASQDRASEDEKRLLSVWAVARQTCLEMGEGWRAANAPPEYTAVYKVGQTRILDLIADVYSGKITWGEFATRRRHVGIEATQRMAEYESRRQQQQAAARADAVRTLLLLNAMQQPPQLNCVTRYIGSAAYTSCQ